MSVRKYRRQLPHWRMEDAVYLVGWRLSKYQEPLQDAERSVVANAIRFFDGQRYALYSFVVMDDHVHVVIRPRARVQPERIIHSWKSFTASSW
jgi:REP element-mobilizing transposase RayT